MRVKKHSLSLVQNPSNPHSLIVGECFRELDLKLHEQIASHLDHIIVHIIPSSGKVRHAFAWDSHYRLRAYDLIHRY